MLAALVCLWIGFALGFCCAAVLRVGAPTRGDVGGQAAVAAGMPDRRRDR